MFGLVYHDLRYNTTLRNPCHNNACSHLCLLVPGGRRCACPDNSVQPTSHRSTAEVVCDAGKYFFCFFMELGHGEESLINISVIIILKFISAAERARPAPKICSCQNGGVCREDESGKLVCECLVEFDGQMCETSLGHSYNPGQSNTAAIVVPIMVFLLVLMAAAGVWYVIRKRPL